MTEARSRSVVFHAYHFPPIGGPGVQRPARMVRYLPEFGYRPIVLTGPGGGSDQWTPADETLLAEIPEGTEVHRVPGPEPIDGRWAGRAQRWLRRPSPWTRWWVGGSVALGTSVGRSGDLVYSWMQPYASAVAGAGLAATLGKPWVADFGDPWAFDEMIAYPTRLHRKLEIARMRETLKRASAIVMSTEEAAQRVRHLLRDSEGISVVAIPNGFDGSDFAGPPPPQEPGVFRIVHTGYLHTSLGRKYERFRAARGILGGSVAGLDVLTRSHVYLVEAIERVLARRPDLHGRLELHLVGFATDSDRSIAAGHEFVQVHGYVPHHEAVAAMRSADLLFLPMHDVADGTRATIVPGKTYEYLASGTPILAAVPAGDARDLLARAGNASICDPKNVDCMADAIAWRIESKEHGGEPDRPPAELVEQYDYRQLARRLADVFDGVPS